MKCVSILREVRLHSPIGAIVVEFCDRGLHSVNQSPEINDSNFKPQQGQPVCLVSRAVETNEAIADCANWLDTYFSNKTVISKTTLPNLCTVNSSEDGSFYDKVYCALLKVPFGKTVSYKQLAALAGSPNAVRAVGSAMARNPFQVVVPCHRVLPSPSASGKQSLGNYSSGKRVAVKKWLLVHEGLKINNGFVL